MELAFDLDVVRNFAMALLIGVLVGIEREKHKAAEGLWNRFIERRAKVKIRVIPALFPVMAVLAVQTLWVPRAAAADAVTALIADLGSANHGKKQRAKEELLVQGKNAIPQLIGALDDPDVKKKTTVIFMLGQLKATGAVPRLIEELKNENTALRLGSAFSLGLVGDSRALPHLEAMLGPGNDSIARGTALVALGYLKNTEALPQVKVALADPDQYTRVIAATALGMLGNREGLDEALSGTESDNPTIVLVSIQALGMIGDTRALPRLEELIQGSKAGKSGILLAKSQIDYANVAPDQRIESLRGYLNDPNEKIVEWAITTLADLGSPEAITLVQEKARAGKSRQEGMAQLKLRMLGK